MSDPRKGKSIWKRCEKPRGEARVENDGKMYYRINRKTGRIETNLLEWERSWKNVKILKYPTRFANELRLGVRDNYYYFPILLNQSYNIYHEHSAQCLISNHDTTKLTHTSPAVNSNKGNALPKEFRDDLEAQWPGINLQKKTHFRAFIMGRNVKLKNRSYSSVAIFIYTITQ